MAENNINKQENQEIFDKILEDLIVSEEKKEQEKKEQEKSKIDTDNVKEPDEEPERTDEYLDKYQRILAEFDNFRKRTAKEKASMYDEGVKETVAQLLPVMDNLERALASAEDKNTDDGLFKGLDMTLKQLKGVFLELGVTEIKSIGEKFDPNLHSAVSHIEDERYGENEIIFEMLKGYKYKDKVIRPSMVQVAN